MSKRNALYIHGFMGNPKGGTFSALENFFRDWKIHSIPFPDLHIDTNKTKQVIKDYCREHDINILIGASLGAFYVLQHEELIDKLVINPCMYPSAEIVKLRDRETGAAFSLDKKVMEDFKEMEKYLDIKDEQKLRVFGIFAKDDELFHYQSSFDELFGGKNKEITNSILIDGHHSIEEQYLVTGLNAADIFFKRIQN